MCDRPCLRLVLGGCTLGDVIAEIEQKFDSEVNILSAGNYCMYNSFDKSQKERLQMPLTQVSTNLPDSSFARSW